MWTRVAIGVLTTALIAISAIAFWGEWEREDAVLAKTKAEKSAAAAKKAEDGERSQRQIAEAEIKKG